MRIQRDEIITVNLTDTASLHAYYMYLIQLEKKGVTYVDEIIETRGSHIVMRVRFHPLRAYDLNQLSDIIKSI